MNDLLQKHLEISKEILISDFILKDGINPTFKIDSLSSIVTNYRIENNLSSHSEKKYSYLDIGIYNPTSNRKLKNDINDFKNKIINGGYLIIQLTNIKIHKYELLGMLMYYGFEKKVYMKSSPKYIVLQKKYEASKIKKPSTGFLISLDRVGYNGKNIKIHKIRSMYRYSEFLHQSMIENSGISSIGKVKEDPRITPIGKLIRKYWIDEIPQIYDLFTFKIKLVGIRAMSYAFFNKYPERYKKKYYKVKPGLICPIFDEKTTGFDEIVRIEEKYLDDYLKNPFLTDVKLFFKTILMIFKGLRSS